jgi:hypothetical protein
MEKDIKKRAIVPFITFLSFLVYSAASIVRGIEHHEPWRILLASAGGVILLTFIVLIVRQVIKEGRKAT